MFHVPIRRARPPVASWMTSLKWSSETWTAGRQMLLVVGHPDSDVERAEQADVVTDAGSGTEARRVP